MTRSHFFQKFDHGPAGRLKVSFRRQAVDHVFKNDESQETPLPRIHSLRFDPSESGSTPKRGVPRLAGAGALILSSLTGLLLPLLGETYEVDNFSRRHREITDSELLLNEETQRLIQQAVTEENARGPCSVPTTLGNTPLPPLLRRITNLLDTNPVATIEEWAVEDLPSQSRHEIATRNSIYSDVSFSDGPILSVAGVEPSIRVAGHYIGADKLGHFMAQGFEYFEILWRSGNVRDALTYGRGLEDGPYGIRTTGVRSFGDLGANFSGMTFYRDLLFGPTPLIVCESGRFRVARRFRWSDYVNDSWDEGINCSEYNPGVTRSVQAALQARQMTCPVQTQSCVRLQALPCSRYFVSPACQRLWPATGTDGSCPRALAGLPTQLALGGPSSNPRSETAEACGPSSGMLSPPATALLRAWEDAEQRLPEDAAESPNLTEDRTT